LSRPISYISISTNDAHKVQENLWLHFFRGEAPFLGGSVAFGGLGFADFGAAPLLALFGATNFVAFGGTIFLVTRLDREEDANVVEGGTYKTVTNPLHL
jgi:hypothetical protein